MLTATSTQCPSCGSPVEPKSDTGRPPVYCRPACRKAAHRRRQATALAAAEVEIAEAAALIARLRSATTEAL